MRKFCFLLFADPITYTIPANPLTSTSDNSSSSRASSTATCANILGFDFFTGVIIVAIFAILVVWGFRLKKKIK